jgi:hypothetical protein
VALKHKKKSIKATKDLKKIGDGELQITLYMFLARESTLLFTQSKQTLTGSE